MVSPYILIFTVLYVEEAQLSSIAQLILFGAAPVTLVASDYVVKRLRERYTRETVE